MRSHWRVGRWLFPLLGALVLTLVLGLSALASSLPVISGFAPAAGTIGTAVAVTGSGLTGATGVGFNGTAASFTVVDDTHVETSVPFGATPGKITVTTPAGSATSATWFNVTPTLSGFSPGCVCRGQ
jgi:hypothetical protein